MKQKIIISIFALILLLNMLLPTENYAISSTGGYTIESYDINMIVNENNTFDIIETIRVNFNSYGKHGIFRKIPLRNTVTRLDGTKSNNRAKISNISVSEKYTTSNENGYKIIKIGDKNRTVTGRKTYTIKYNYNIGKDPLKDVDELYFNLIGDEWDTSIGEVTFTITMPKSFDKSLLGFSSGAIGSTNSSNVSYEVNGNVISGHLKNTLYAEQALTVRLTLPEGYFVGASNNFDYWTIFKIILSIFFVIIAYRLWQEYGKDDMVVETVEFYPPENLNSVELGFIYKGNSEKQDIISLLIYLANKGYLKIEEYGEKTLKGSKNKEFKIIKIKDYDGDNEVEKAFFEGLFSADTEKLDEIVKNILDNKQEKDKLNSTKEVTKSDLYNKFYKVLDEIRSHMNRKEHQEKIFEKVSLGKRRIVVVMIIIVFLLMGGLSYFKIGNVEGIIMIFFLLAIPLFLTYCNPNRGTIYSTALVFSVFGILCMLLSEYAIYEEISAITIVSTVILTFCLIMLIIFLGIMRKRTQYGTEMLGKIKGFKNFLEIAEKQRLEELVMEDPEYFYNILPYTYVLGVSDKWIKKFEDIALVAPKWYYGYSNFSTYEFNRFMNSTYSSISTAMSSSPSSHSGGGSGGGSSGGGSGGGGGGSW